MVGPVGRRRRPHRLLRGRATTTSSTRSSPRKTRARRLNSRGLDVGEVLSHRVTGLFNGTTYYVRVRAHNENDSGNGSNDASATPAGPPLAPRELSQPAGTALGNGRVELTWDAPARVANTPPPRVTTTPVNPISSYEYSQDGSWRSIPNSDASTTSYTVTGLRNGTSYQFRVRARNRAGIGRPSNGGPRRTQERLSPARPRI